jgi:hypothetical protein
MAKRIAEPVTRYRHYNVSNNGGNNDYGHGCHVFLLSALPKFITSGPGATSGYGKRRGLLPNDNCLNFSLCTSAFRAAARKSYSLFFKQFPRIAVFSPET